MILVEEPRDPPGDQERFTGHVEADAEFLRLPRQKRDERREDLAQARDVGDGERYRANRGRVAGNLRIRRPIRRERAPKPGFCLFERNIQVVASALSPRFRLSP